jgi:hypothetical protein
VQPIARTFLLPIVLGALATPAGAQSLQVVGYSGYLGEWELTATVTEDGSSPTQYAGPMMMKHVGICSQDGPEEKSGKMRFQILSPASSRLEATLFVAGIECSYSGKLSDYYSGTLTCPDREPVPLKLWVK